MREYGWSALGVYFLLTAVDFPFCYLLVQMLGPDRVGVFPFPFLFQVMAAGIAYIGRLTWDRTLGARCSLKYRSSNPGISKTSMA